MDKATKELPKLTFAIKEATPEKFPADVVVYNATTIQLSSEPIPVPVLFESFRYFAYWGVV